MMQEKKYLCWSCQSEIDMSVRIQRKDECNVCGADLHLQELSVLGPWISE